MSDSGTVARGVFSDAPNPKPSPPPRTVLGGMASEAWDSIWGGRAKHKPFTDSFFGWSYRIMRTALLAVALAWTYVIIVPVASKSRALTFTRGYPPRTTITPASIPSRPWALGSRRKWRR